MKASAIIHNMLVELQRGNQVSEMYGLGLSKEVSRLFQDSASLELKSRKVIEMKTGTPMTNGGWAAIVVNREERIISAYNYFNPKHDLIRLIWKKHSM